ncbi:hypothetical protein ACGK9R_13600 [Halomonas sp. HNIBRBA4712]|uniref:hypothetical protein n=1 Tax=Halomonas sp. HNIBRBA4712 TaxID=3373087 RepID=UPI00374683D9
MYQEFLETTYPNQQATIAAYTLAGEQVWLKRAAKRNSRLAYAPLTWLATLMRVEALRPVPNLGGEQSIRTEAARLRALADAGIRVPPLLATHPQALLLADAGAPGAPAPTLLEELKRAPSEQEIDALLALATDALIDVHRKGAYLSEAFGRNVLVTQGRVVFIDFETDPGEVLSPVNCMVRDWYCFIFSLYGRFHKKPLQRECLAPALRDALSHEREDVRQRFKAALPSLLRLKCLPFRYFGSDGKKIHVTLAALAELNDHLP